MTKRHSCIRSVRNTLQGGSLPGTEPVARMPVLRQGGGAGGGEADTTGRTDGHQGCGAMDWRRSDRVKQDFAPPKCETLLPGQIQKGSLFFFCLRLFPLSSYPNFQHPPNPVSWFTKSRFFGSLILLCVFLVVSSIFAPNSRFIPNPVWKTIY